MDGRKTIRSMVRHVAKLSRAKFIVFRRQGRKCPEQEKGARNFFSKSERDILDKFLKTRRSKNFKFLIVNNKKKIEKFSRNWYFHFESRKRRWWECAIGKRTSEWIETNVKFLPEGEIKHARRRSTLSPEIFHASQRNEAFQFWSKTSSNFPWNFSPLQRGRMIFLAKTTCHSVN